MNAPEKTPKKRGRPRVAAGQETKKVTVRLSQPQVDALEAIGWKLELTKGVRNEPDMIEVDLAPVIRLAVDSYLAGQPKRRRAKVKSKQRRATA